MSVVQAHHLKLRSIFRPHCSTMYVDTAYCYRPCSVVCLSVTLSVGLSAILVSPAKTAKPIEMPFGLRTLVGRGNHVLNRDPDTHGKRQFLVGMERPIVKYRDTLQSIICAKTAKLIEAISNVRFAVTYCPIVAWLWSCDPLLNFGAHRCWNQWI